MLSEGASRSHHLACLANLVLGLNVTNIALVLELMNSVYTTNTTLSDSVVTGASFAGMLIGQLAFGWLADYTTPRRALLLAIAITETGAIASIFSSGGSDSSVYASLAFFRFVMGIGLGAIYPLR